jgi:hypothetical protein
MSKMHFPKALLLVAFAIILFDSCRKDEDFTEPDSVSSNTTANKYPPQTFSSDIAQQWYGLFLKLIKDTPGHTPPVAARELGYTGIALYESVTGGLQSHQTLAGQLSGLAALPVRQNGKHYVPSAEANAALARIIKDLVGNASTVNVATIDSMETANEQFYMSTYDPADVALSVSFGHSIADAIYTWSLTDGGHQGYLSLFPASYIPPTGVDKWVPTPPLFQSAMLPYWGNNRAMVPANNTSAVNPPLPPVFGAVAGNPMYDAANLVYTTGINLTQGQKDIANFWADGGGTYTPPGHNVAIAVQIIHDTKVDLQSASVVLAKLGIAENDAGIVCWRAKFTSNLIRPVTYIKTYIDANWSPYIATPPFPSYTSGHSTFSSAAASVLTAEFGANYSFTDNTKNAFGFTARSFTGFQQAAQEAAVSRLYGGIHYEFDNVNGYNCGADIAGNVSRVHF